jgi:hypothetical protein
MRQGIKVLTTADRALLSSGACFDSSFRGEIRALLPVLAVGLIKRPKGEPLINFEVTDACFGTNESSRDISD